MSKIFFVVFVACVVFLGCQKKEQASQWSTEDSLRIVNEIVKHRQEIESFFRNHPDSPFNQDSATHFSGIKWYDPDVRYYFKSRLFRHNKSEQVKVHGTKGEERTYVKYGYFKMEFPAHPAGEEDSEYTLNVYKDADAASNYLSVWFTDETTGKETYEVGRYVEIGNEVADPNYKYTLDFNKAFNPYCAYSAKYSCAVPRREDHLAFAVRAGELKYHE
ncbi:MAG: DUF1684 domain-containing protein [Ignavibacteriae bacterium]|nr:DUF1684 domain-containing protein [Ignavibacteriota bacterium]